MGAKGLKRLLLSLISKQNIFHSFKHKTIGIDASVLLHKYFGVQDVVDEFLEERYQTLVKGLSLLTSNSSQRGMLK